MSSDRYKQLLHDNVTKEYHHSSEGAKRTIDVEASTIATKLGIADRVEICAERSAYVTMKDHKEDFWRKPSCRLINPAKSEIGMISKRILEDLCNHIRTTTRHQQWRSTKDILNWFSNIPAKPGKRFIKFDVVSFYPSITEELLRKAISFAKLHTAVTDQQQEIIYHARKSLLFCLGETWEKKSSQFDVTMGSYDGAEVCELVGLFMLDQLKQRFPKDDMGLYRDDGLGVTSSSGRVADKARKDVVQIFKSHGLQVTIETLLPQTDFLDVTLDITIGKY